MVLTSESVCCVLEQDTLSEFFWGYGHIVCLFQILSCNIHNTFNLLLILIQCSHSFLCVTGQCAVWRNST